MSTIWKRGEKTVVVTGGTKGIGYETASGLATRGATVIIVGRDAQRGAAAASSMQHYTGNAAISFLQADLSLLAEVRRLAEQITREHSHIHVLVNNAGGVNAQRRVTAEGLEATFVTNHLAPFLLTNLLLPMLKTSPSARIVNVNSVQHRSGRIDFDDLQLERAYDMMRAYRQAKLANLFFTYELTLVDRQACRAEFDLPGVLTGRGRSHWQVCQLPQKGGTFIISLLRGSNR